LGQKTPLIQFLLAHLGEDIFEDPKNHLHGSFLAPPSLVANLLRFLRFFFLRKEKVYLVEEVPICQFP
jgi:hypothetical protein